ncbi:CsiV family protein [Allohahella marinimesophila]|uniref:Peptidoglycan-binding protein CsiV n=1 Tax=Allohahella marinimesophila TaxID=1054972 RepID=A0ABP7Q906_9GAMM
MNRLRLPARAMTCAAAMAAALISSLGQAPVLAAENEATVYQLELIIFRNYPISESERLLPLPPREIETGDAAEDITMEAASDDNALADTAIETSTELYGPEASFGAKRADGSPLLEPRDDAIPLGDANDDRWPLMLRKDFMLNDVLGNLERAYGYRVLWHGSVMLPMVKQRDYHFTLETSTLDDNRWSLQGQLQFRLSRFMHMNATLVLTDHTGSQGEPVYTTEDANGTLGTSGEIFGRYVLQQSRRMKSGQLHYIDHPAIGVLAMIQSVSEDATRREGPDNAEALKEEELGEEE